MNRLTIFGLVLLSLFGMTLAAVLGMFQATSTEPTAEDLAVEMDAQAEAYTQLPAEAEAQELLVKEQQLIATRATRERLAEETATQKLQEIRDAYISFPQAFSDVVIQFQTGPQCDGAPACSIQDSEILVDKQWAQSSSREEQDLVLAREHAHLAIDRVWHDRAQAKAELEAIIPTCTVEEDAKLLAEATNQEAPPLPTEDEISLTALSDVIVTVMTGNKEEGHIYPSQFHTPQQIQVAEQVSVGERPEIVIPVSLPTCGQ